MKSCIRTRAGWNGISTDGSALASQVAIASTSSELTEWPSSSRSVFSSSTLIEYGRRATSKRRLQRVEAVDLVLAASDVDGGASVEAVLAHASSITGRCYLRGNFLALLLALLLLLELGLAGRLDEPVLLVGLDPDDQVLPPALLGELLPGLVQGDLDRAVLAAGDRDLAGADQHARRLLLLLLLALLLALALRGGRPRPAASRSRSRPWRGRRPTWPGSRASRRPTSWSSSACRRRSSRWRRSGSPRNPARASGRRGRTRPAGPSPLRPPAPGRCVDRQPDLEVRDGDVALAVGGTAVGAQERAARVLGQQLEPGDAPGLERVAVRVELEDLARGAGLGPEEAAGDEALGAVRAARRRRRPAIWLLERAGARSRRSRVVAPIRVMGSVTAGSA